MNPLKKLCELGQAVWLDDIHRDLFKTGELERLIEEDGLRGMTSNPAIFKKAIADSSDYDEDIAQLKSKGLEVKEILEALTVKDVQTAADIFRPLYNRTNGEHGYVSLEVNPHLARHTLVTVEEARRLWRSLNRPNVFIKVPATSEGLAAIEQLISEGINVNVTLLFGLPRYGEVANAFIAGIERLMRSGGDVSRVRSVASFFLSRIDVLFDPKLEEIAKQGGERGELARSLRGEIAIASARQAYQMYKQIFSGDRWKRLSEKGAHAQRLLWASTSTKNPEYHDLKYVEPLIGPDTINTVPRETLEAYRDHGNPQVRLEDDLDKARNVLTQMSKLDLDINAGTQQLEAEGIEKFCKPYDALLETLEHEVASV